MLISYVIDEVFFLIVNRSICSEDIKEFEYSPTKNISGTVNIFNEPDEKATLKRFFDVIKQS